MADERTHQLELIAATLTQAYYSARESNPPIDHRDVMETYLFFLDALMQHEGHRPGQVPIKAADTLAPFEPEPHER
jgi:hypothetical protein